MITNNYIKSELIAEFPTLAEPLEKFSRYRLTSDASFADKFNYCLYRLLNAVKAIFNRSDWQCARRELIDQHVPKIFKTTFGDNLIFNMRCIELIVDGALALGTDSKLQKYEPLNAEWNVKSLKEINQLAISHFKSALKELYKLSEIGVDLVIDEDAAKKKHDLRSFSAWQTVSKVKDELRAFERRVKETIRSPVESTKIQDCLEKFVIAAGKQGYIEQSSVKSVNAALGAMHVIYCQNIKALAAKIDEKMSNR